MLAQEQAETTLPSGKVISATPGFDARFPNQNQTKRCWQNFVDFHRCKDLKGEDAPVCLQFKKTYHAMCPSGWTDRWNEQIENGTFPAVLTARKPSRPVE